MGHRIAVSAVNLTEGGTLTILREFVVAACEILPLEWSIVVFVHDQRLLNVTRAQVVEIPYAKKGYLRRLYVEWIEFETYARKLKPDIWVSLHDITPRVGAVRQIVYCHNPMPFFRLRLRDIWFEPKAFLFRYLYGVVYRLNLSRNYAVVVQQSWLRDEFKRWLGPKNKIIVAHPTVQWPIVAGVTSRPERGDRARFLYPALPRSFKNVELICRAVRRLECLSSWRSEVVLTIARHENRYARWLFRHFGNLRTIRFAGRQTAEDMLSLYANADCLIFPSLLETWGLPITEAKRLGMPMFVADLPYAHETVGNYDRVAFIDVDDPVALAEKMLAFQDHHDCFLPARVTPPASPFASNWRELFILLVQGID
jgi:glycosyltransferase involved in cell wall biosynthesis